MPVGRYNQLTVEISSTVFLVLNQTLTKFFKTTKNKHRIIFLHKTTEDNKEINMKQWSELRFILTKNDTSSLELGGSKYILKKSNSLFDSLLTFESSSYEREIEIECYISHAEDINDFNTFFELSDNSQTYKLEAYFNGSKYNATVVTADKPIEVTAIEDLYGTHTQPSATVKINLVMSSPFFYGDYSYNYEIGSGVFPKVQYPLTQRFGDNSLFMISLAQNLVPHVIDNTGNEDNGLIVTIKAYKPIVNPTIYNETTGLSMTFNLSVDSNSIIKINTIEKCVYVDGVYQGNVKNLFDKWLELIDGKNVIKFDSESGAEYAQVQVQFYNKYRALK